MKYSSWTDLIHEKLEKLDSWRNEFGVLPSEKEQHSFFSSILDDLVEKLKGNYPFHHPSYAGQMLKPPHPIAWIAYVLASTINPNNHALDGGPPTSEMEKEVVADLAKMVGFPRFLGHLTSSGTIANLEALWILSKQIQPGKKIAFSDKAHYTHERICSVLQIPTIKINTDFEGNWDFEQLASNLNEIGAVVVTMGTTGAGFVEPLSKIIDLVKNACLIHIDAAYGGFFNLISDELPSQNDWGCISKAHSIVIDPHKHGLQPYGCGSVLFSDPTVGRFYKHDSPYTYFSSDELHLGEISLECSRAGASAAALWATLKAFPLTKQGFGSILLDCRNAALQFAEELKQTQVYKLVHEPSLDIVIYYPVLGNKITSKSISEESKRIFHFGMNAPAKEGFHLSLFTMNSSDLYKIDPSIQIDSEKVQVLRSVFLKPEHKKFTSILTNRLVYAINS